MLVFHRFESNSQIACFQFLGTSMLWIDWFVGTTLTRNPGREWSTHHRWQPRKEHRAKVWLEREPLWKLRPKKIIIRGKTIFSASTASFWILWQTRPANTCYFCESRGLSFDPTYTAVYWCLGTDSQMWLWNISPRRTEHMLNRDL